MILARMKQKRGLWGDVIILFFDLCVVMPPSRMEKRLPGDLARDPRGYRIGGFSQREESGS